MNSSREKILAAVRQAVKVPSQLQDPPPDLEQKFQQKLDLARPKDLVDRFMNECKKVSAHCSLIKSKELTAKITGVLEAEKIDSLAVSGHVLEDQLAVLGRRQNLKLVNASELGPGARRLDISTASAGLVKARYGVADIGSLTVLIEDTGSTLPWFLPDTIIAVVHARDIVRDIFELFKTVPADKLKNAVLVTGPSRTADIEKILILGAHGPKKLVILILED